MTGREQEVRDLVTRATRGLIDASRNATDAAAILVEALAALDDVEPERPMLRVLPGTGEKVATRHCRLTGTARHLHSAP